MPPTDGRENWAPEDLEGGLTDIRCALGFSSHPHFLRLLLNSASSNSLSL